MCVCVCVRSQPRWDEGPHASRCVLPVLRVAQWCWWREAGGVTPLAPLPPRVGASHNLRFAGPRFPPQVQKEKVDLENQLEAEQEFFVNKLQAQMEGLKAENT